MTTASRCSAPTATANRPWSSCSRRGCSRSTAQITRAARLKIAYFAQHQLDELNLDASAYDHVRKLMPDAAEAKVRARGRRHRLFRRQAADTPVARLSGGEKARLLLGLATFGGPHLLILDEPTNHLDIDSRAALIEAINDYPGAVILVSHDRYLLDACADRLWLVADGKVTPFDGDLEDYRRHVLSRPRRRRQRPRQAEPRAPPASAERAAARQRAELAPLRERITRAEAEIARLTARDRAARRHARRRRAVRARSGTGRGARQDARRRCRRAGASRGGMACERELPNCTPRRLAVAVIFGLAAPLGVAWPPSAAARRRARSIQAAAGEAIEPGRRAADIGQRG